jgi:hypothetical protein
MSIAITAPIESDVNPRCISELYELLLSQTVFTAEICQILLARDDFTNSSQLNNNNCHVEQKQQQQQEQDQSSTNQLTSDIKPWESQIAAEPIQLSAYLINTSRPFYFHLARNLWQWLD